VDSPLHKGNDKRKKNSNHNERKFKEWGLMKRLLLSICLVLLIGFFSGCANNEQAYTIDVSDEVEVELGAMYSAMFIGMNSAECEVAVTQLFADLGLRVITISADDDWIEFEYNPDVISVGQISWLVAELERFVFMDLQQGEREAASQEIVSAGLSQIHNTLATLFPCTPQVVYIISDGIKHEPFNHFWNFRASSSLWAGGLDERPEDVADELDVFSPGSDFQIFVEGERMRTPRYIVFELTNDEWVSLLNEEYTVPFLDLLYPGEYILVVNVSWGNEQSGRIGQHFFRLVI